MNLRLWYHGNKRQASKSLIYKVLPTDSKIFPVNIIGTILTHFFLLFIIKREPTRCRSVPDVSMCNTPLVHTPHKQILKPNLFGDIFMRSRKFQTLEYSRNLFNTICSQTFEANLLLCQFSSSCLIPHFLFLLF